MSIFHRFFQWLWKPKAPQPRPDEQRPPYPVRLYPATVNMVLDSQQYLVKAASLSINHLPYVAPGKKIFCFSDAIVSLVEIPKPGERVLYVDRILDVTRGSVMYSPEVLGSIIGIIDFTVQVTGPVFITHLLPDGRNHYSTRWAQVSTLTMDPHEAINREGSYTPVDALESNDTPIEARIVLE